MHSGRTAAGIIDMEENRPIIYLYTDGASSGNPGPGGYGVVLKCGNLRKEMSGGFIMTTNNRMELLAVIVGLEAIKWQNARVEIWSDSSYVVNAVNKGWLGEWKRKGFAKVKNPDLWMRFLRVSSMHRIEFHWLKGHAGHPENERCDDLAVDAGAGAFSRGESLPHDTGYEESVEMNGANTANLPL